MSDRHHDDTPEKLDATSARSLDGPPLAPTSAIWVRFDHEPSTAQLRMANRRLKTLVDLGVTRARVVLGGVVLDVERKVTPAATPTTVGLDTTLLAEGDGTWVLVGTTDGTERLRAAANVA